MKDYSAFEFNPEMPPSIRTLFDRFRLLTLAGFSRRCLLALINSLIAG